MGIEAKATFTQDLKYFDELFSEWDRYEHTMGRLRLPVGMIAVLAGILFIIYFEDSMVIAYSIIILGLFEAFLTKQLHRMIYLRRVKKQKIIGTDVTLEFFNDEVKIHSIHADSTCDWEIFTKYKETPMGMFLYTNKWRFYYVPDSALQQPEAKRYIIDRIKSVSESK